MSKMSGMYYKQKLQILNTKYYEEERIETTKVYRSKKREILQSTDDKNRRETGKTVLQRNKSTKTKVHPQNNNMYGWITTTSGE